MNAGVLLDPVRSVESAAGAATAALALTLSRAAIVQRRVSPRSADGLALVVAMVAALDATNTSQPGLVVAVALLAVGGWWAGRLPTAWQHAAAITPGAVALAAHSGVPGPAWLRPAVGAAVLVLSPAVAQTERRAPAVFPTLLLVVVGAVYLTVPDTEQVLVVLGAAAVAALLPLAGGRLGPACIPALIGVAAWAAAVDGRGRQSAAVGGLACLALLAVEPAVGMLTRRRPLVDRFRAGWPRHLAATLLVGVLCAPAVLVVGRAASSGRALVEGASLLAVALAGVAAVSRRPATPGT